MRKLRKYGSTDIWSDVNRRFCPTLIQKHIQRQTEKTLWQCFFVEVTLKSVKKLTRSKLDFD